MRRSVELGRIQAVHRYDVNPDGSDIRGKVFVDTSGTPMWRICPGHASCKGGTQMIISTADDDEIPHAGRESGEPVKQYMLDHPGRFLR